MSGLDSVTGIPETLLRQPVTGLGQSSAEAGPPSPEIAAEERFARARSRSAIACSNAGRASPRSVAVLTTDIGFYRTSRLDTRS